MRIATLVARSGSAVLAIRATTVRDAVSLPTTERIRPNAGAASRSIAVGASGAKWRACSRVPTTRLSCSWRTRWLACCSSAACSHADGHQRLLMLLDDARAERGERTRSADRG